MIRADYSRVPSERTCSGADTTNAISLSLVPREFKTLQLNGRRTRGWGYYQTPCDVSDRSWLQKTVSCTSHCVLISCSLSLPKQARIRKVRVLFKSVSSPGKENFILQSPRSHSSLWGEQFKCFAFLFQPLQSCVIADFCPLIFEQCE